MYKNSQNTHSYARDTPRIKLKKHEKERIASYLKKKSAREIEAKAKAVAKAKKLLELEVNTADDSDEKKWRERKAKIKAAAEKRIAYRSQGASEDENSNAAQDALNELVKCTYYCYTCKSNYDVNKLLPSRAGTKWRKCSVCGMNFQYL